jgi:hypothetical protein
MTMTIETPEVLGSEDNVAALNALGTANGEPNGGEAEDAPFAAELDQMTKTADALKEQGLLTAEEAAEQHAEVEQTRRRYEDLTPEEKRAVNRRLREQGRRLLERKVSGAPVIVETVTLNHNRLTPIIETWWAFLNRMSVNIGRFGRTTFDGQKQADTVQKWFEDQQTKLHGYVSEQVDVAKAFTAQAEQLIIENGRKPLRPIITRPSLVIEVEAFTPYSYDLLQTIIAFDQAMGYFDFMVFNRVRDQSDVDDEVNRFINKLRPVGLRGLNTHRKLMLTINNLH